VRTGDFDAYLVRIVEEGIRARDMVMFEMELGPAESSPSTSSTSD
jgi:hypothetical protein